MLCVYQMLNGSPGQSVTVFVVTLLMLFIFQMPQMLSGGPGQSVTMSVFSLLMLFVFQILSGGPGQSVTVSVFILMTLSVFQMLQMLNGGSPGLSVCSDGADAMDVPSDAGDPLHDCDLLQELFYKRSVSLTFVCGATSCHSLCLRKY